MKLIINVLFLIIISIVLAEELTGEDFRGHHDLTIDVLNDMEKENKGNMIFSVSAIDSILALTALGAKGHASKQIRRALQLPKTDEKIKKKYNEIHRSILRVGKINITSANRIYIADGIEVDPEFRKVAKEVFQTDVVNIDFKDAEKSVLEINTWFQDQMREKIKDILRKEQVQADTKMALIASHHFQGHWKYPFPKDLTKKSPFRISETETVEVDMMEVTANIEIFRSDKYNGSIVHLPIDADNTKPSLAMWLPDGFDGFENFDDETFRKIVLDQRYHGTTRESVKLFMPKIRIDSSIDMMHVMEKLGITKISKDPDFSGICKDPMKVDIMSQKTVLEINEDGIGGVPSSTNVPEKVEIEGTPKEIRVDRPFLFVILMNEDELLMLAGRIMNPLMQ